MLSSSAARMLVSEASLPSERGRIWGPQGPEIIVYYIIFIKFGFAREVHGGFIEDQTGLEVLQQWGFVYCCYIKFKAKICLAHAMIRGLILTHTLSFKFLKTLASKTFCLWDTLREVANNLFNEPF